MGDEDPNSIGQNLRLTIKRSKLNVSIILKESDESAKYDLFQRLNTGGSRLSAQEVRNCILVMLNKDFYFWLSELANYDKFVECTALSDKAVSESYDIELVLRFIIFSLVDTKDLESMSDVGTFLTEKMREICTDTSFNTQLWGIYSEILSITSQVHALTVHSKDLISARKNSLVASSFHNMKLFPMVWHIIFQRTHMSMMMI